jgi:CheY-like chemotaxis protein
MQPGGTLTLETFNITIDSESFRPEEPPPGDYVGLAIKDTGTGIPDDILPHVFEPFVTTKERGKGSGLGLAQVFGFAKQSGGGVRIETRLGQGTAVKIFLPRAWVDVSDYQADFVDTSNRPQTTKTLRVLVVDDDKAVLKSTVRMLDFLGYATASAESGIEALRLLARNQEINPVLADFAMPEMSGGELAKAICAMRPTLPVIFITGYSDLDVLKEFNDSRIAAVHGRRPSWCDRRRTRLGQLGTFPMSVVGTSRHTALPHEFGRYRSKADVVSHMTLGL